MTQTADTLPGPPRGSFLDEVKSAVTPRAALLVIGATALQLLFITSCAGALIIDPRSTTDTLLVASGGGTVRSSALYPVVGWCVGGHLCASVLAISTGAGPADPRRAVIRLVSMALVSIIGGLGGAVIVGPILGALPGSIMAPWGLGALIIFAVGAATLALQGRVGGRHRDHDGRLRVPRQAEAGPRGAPDTQNVRGRP
ncbi:hypothetical protein ACWFRM_17490, partial [Streptomyces sp. NPDC055144]